MNIQFPELTFRVKNLGSVQHGEFTHKPLTIFCGENNTGKTWTLYSLYNFYDWLHYEVKSDKGTEFVLEVDAFNEATSAQLPIFFNTSSEQLDEAGLYVINGEVWRRFVVASDGAEAFLIPAERNGLNLFFHELRRRRTSLLHHVSRESIDVEELLRDAMQSPYAEPIADYIDWLNQLPAIQQARSSDFHAYAERVKRNLARGAYSVDSRTGNVTFRPYRASREGRRPTTMGLHIASSAVKSLFALWFYLEHQARPGNILMIDEPELNLHPASQLQVARLLARLVNAGIRVVISTHSDYIVREFNSLIMLSQQGGKRLQRKYRYHDEEVLSLEQVGAYWFEDQTIKPFKITNDDGIHADTFDEVIKQLNTVNNDIYYSLREMANE